MRTFIIFFSFLLLTQVYTNSDQDSRDFFTGIMRAGLNYDNWYDNQLLSSINSTNFNFKSILKSMDFLLIKGSSATTQQLLNSLSNIAVELSKVTETLFPIIAFSVDFNILERAIPEKYNDVFKVLNKTLNLYLEPENLLSSLRNADDIKIICKESIHGNYLSAGYFFEKLNNKLRNQNNLGNFQIDVDLSGASELLKRIMNSAYLLKGLLDSSTGLTLTDVFLSKINGDNFNADAICKAYGVLSKNSFDFDNHPNDQESFIETNGAITVYLRNILEIAKQIDDKSLSKQLQFIFDIFANHKELYQRIQIAKSLKININDKMEEIYNLGEIKNDFEGAGKKWGELVNILNSKNQPTDSFINFQIDVDLSGASALLKKIMNSMYLLKGLMDSSTGFTLSEAFITKINGDNFNADAICKAFGILAHNSFDFETNPNDQETFIETNGEISLYLKNVLDAAVASGDKETQKNLEFIFNLFANHKNLLNRIQFARKQKIDINEIMLEIYNLGEIKNDFEKAGNKWGALVNALNSQNRLVTKFLEK